MENETLKYIIEYLETESGRKVLSVMNGADKGVLVNEEVSIMHQLIELRRLLRKWTTCQNSQGVKNIRRVYDKYKDAEFKEQYWSDVALELFQAIKGDLCLEKTAMNSDSEVKDMETGHDKVVSVQPLVIKPCPFCRVEGEIFEGKHKNQCGEEYGDFPYIVVVCVSCRSRGREIPIKFFNEFSKCTVKQFKHNNLLRAKEECRYDDYLSNKRIEAINAWNNRAL